MRRADIRGDGFASARADRVPVLHVEAGAKRRVCVCRGRWAKAPDDGGPRAIALTVRRTDIMGDGFAALQNVGAAIKGRLMVTFVNQHGTLEAGIDHGGLVKEFLEEVSSPPDM